MRPRRNPRTPSTPDPKHPSIKHKQRGPRRGPKTEKPVADLPFASPGREPREPKSSSLDRQAISEIDYSGDALNALEKDFGPLVMSITWHNNTGAKDNDDLCYDLEMKSWDNIESFLDDRRDEQKAQDDNVGIMGVSHPGCDCFLIVELDNGARYRVTVSSSTPSLVGGAPPAREGPGEEEAPSGEEGEVVI